GRQRSRGLQARSALVYQLDRQAEAPGELPGKALAAGRGLPYIRVVRGLAALDSLGARRAVSLVPRGAPDDERIGAPLVDERGDRRPAPLERFGVDDRQRARSARHRVADRHADAQAAEIEAEQRL